MQLTPEQEKAIRDLKIDDLTARYIALRDMKSKLVEDTKGAVARIDAGMGKLETLMLAWLQLYGLESAPTKSGTPYLTDKTGANMADRDAFNRFVLADPVNRLGFFTNAVSKDTVKAFMDANEGVPPPGVNWFSEKAVNFKRAS